MVLSHLPRCPLKVSGLTSDMHWSVYGMALNSLSICLAVECWIFVRNFSLRAVGIVADLIHLRLPTLPVSRPSIFSFLPSICCHAFWIRNHSLLLSRLYVFSVFSLS